MLTGFKREVYSNHTELTAEALVLVEPSPNFTSTSVATCHTDSKLSSIAVGLYEGDFGLPG